MTRVFEFYFWKKHIRLYIRHLSVPRPRTRLISLLIWDITSTLLVHILRNFHLATYRNPKHWKKIIFWVCVILFNSMYFNKSEWVTLIRIIITQTNAKRNTYPTTLAYIRKIDLHLHITEVFRTLWKRFW